MPFTLTTGCPARRITKGTIMDELTRILRDAERRNEEADKRAAERRKEREALNTLTDLAHRIDLPWGGWCIDTDAGFLAWGQHIVGFIEAAERCGRGDKLRQVTEYRAKHFQAPGDQYAAHLIAEAVGHRDAQTIARQLREAHDRRILDGVQGVSDGLGAIGEWVRDDIDLAALAAEAEPKAPPPAPPPEPLVVRTGAPKRKPGKFTPEQLESLEKKSRRFLTHNPKATREQVAAHLGVALGSVSKLQAWKSRNGGNQGRGTSPPSGMGRIGLDIALEREAQARHREQGLAELAAEQEADDRAERNGRMYLPS